MLDVNVTSTKTEKMSQTVVITQYQGPGRHQKGTETSYSVPLGGNYNIKIPGCACQGSKNRTHFEGHVYSLNIPIISTGRSGCMLEMGLKFKKIMIGSLAKSIPILGGNIKFRYIVQVIHCPICIIDFCYISVLITGLSHVMMLNTCRRILTI